MFKGRVADLDLPGIVAGKGADSPQVHFSFRKFKVKWPVLVAVLEIKRETRVGPLFCSSSLLSIEI